MLDQQLLRYGRQILISQIDLEGQTKLLQSKVLIIGLGGLGSPVAMYLAAAGVGTITLCDYDTVELSNLQRQIIHQTPDIGRKKVVSAKETLAALNPDIQVNTLDYKLDDEQLSEQVANTQVVIDSSDNFATRFAINQACCTHGVPLVSGAAIHMEGQVSVFRHDQNNQPCYACLYSDKAVEPPQTCSDTGILSPVVGIIGSIQATETIKLLLNIGETLSSRLLLLDALHMDIRTIRFKKDNKCPVCSI